MARVSLGVAFLSVDRLNTVGYCSCSSVFLPFSPEPDNTSFQLFLFYPSLPTNEAHFLSDTLPLVPPRGTLTSSPQVVIFPGALVPPSAYAPLARTMARKGYPSYILRFEFNLGE